MGNLHEWPRQGIRSPSLAQDHSKKMAHSVRRLNLRNEVENQPRKNKKQMVSQDHGQMPIF